MTQPKIDEQLLIKVLDYLGRDLDPSILIGGWATQLRVGGEISHDIDLIIASPEVRSRLKTTLSDYSENHHHSGGMKVRGSVDQVHIDAYIPHESFLGSRLKLDVAVLAKHVGPETVRGWRLLTLEAHLATKLAALIDRPDSEKGAKDAREVHALMGLGPNVSETAALILEASGASIEDLPHLIALAFDLIPDRANLNKLARKSLAASKRIWVDEFKRQMRRRSNEL